MKGVAQPTPYNAAQTPPTPGPPTPPNLRKPQASPSRRTPRKRTRKNPSTPESSQTPQNPHPPQSRRPPLNRMRTYVPASCPAIAARVRGSSAASAARVAAARAAISRFWASKNDSPSSALRIPGGAAGTRARCVCVCVCVRPGWFGGFRGGRAAPAIGCRAAAPRSAHAAAPLCPGALSPRHGRPCHQLTLAAPPAAAAAVPLLPLLLLLLLLPGPAAAAAAPGGSARDGGGASRGVGRFEGGALGELLLPQLLGLRLWMGCGLSGYKTPSAGRLSDWLALLCLPTFRHLPRPLSLAARQNNAAAPACNTPFPLRQSAASSAPPPLKSQPPKARLRLGDRPGGRRRDGVARTARAAARAAGRTAGVLHPSLHILEVPKNLRVRAAPAIAAAAAAVGAAARGGGGPVARHEPGGGCGGFWRRCFSFPFRVAGF